MKNRLPASILAGEWTSGDAKSPIALPGKHGYRFPTGDSLPRSSDDIHELMVGYSQVKLIRDLGPSYRGLVKKCGISPEVQAIVEHSTATMLHPNRESLPPQLPDLSKFSPELKPMLMKLHILGCYQWLAEQVHLEPGCPIDKTQALRNLYSSEDKEELWYALCPITLAHRDRIRHWPHNSPATRTKGLISIMQSIERMISNEASKLGVGEKKGKGVTLGDQPGNGLKIWGEMQMLYPELVNRIRRPKAVKRAFVGSPCYIHRFVTDGMMFRLSKRSVYGTILVDVSGSMSLSPQEVEAAIHAKPLATVAVYSGDDCRQGHLSIIAQNGRVIDFDKASWPCGNTVDGLALDWLATQAAPRIWVSDGGITHPFGSRADAVRYCNRVTREASITRYHSFAHYLKNFLPLASLAGDEYC